MKKEELITLIRICESLKETYEEMALLEKQNKRDSKEFRKLVERLKTTRNVEKNIIANLGLTKETLKYLSKELYISYDPNQNISDTIVLNNQGSQNNLVLERIMQRFKERIYLNANEVLRGIVESMVPKEFLESGEKIIPEEAFKDYTGLAETKLSIKRDISILVYKFLEEAILLETDAETKNALIDYKYSLIILDSSLEEFLMNSWYQPLENVYLESEIIAALLQLSSCYTDLKNSIVTPIITQEIQESMQRFDYELDYPKVKSAIIFRNIIIKSCLELLSLETIEKLQREFIDKANLLQHNGYYNRTRVQSMINNSFESSKHKLEGVSKLTLKG